MSWNLRNGPPSYAREFKSMVSLAAYQEIVPEIEKRTPTRKRSLRNPKLRYSVTAFHRLEYTEIRQGGTWGSGKPRINFVPWWGFIINKGSKPHYLGRGGTGGAWHPGFPATNHFERGIQAGLPGFEATVLLSMNQFMRWLAGSPTRTGFFTNEVKVQAQHRKDMQERVNAARRAHVAAVKMGSRDGPYTPLFIPGLQNVGRL